MSFPNVTATLADADRDKVISDTQDCWTLLPFLVNITDDEKKAIPKMGAKSVGWVEKVFEYVQANPKFVPPYLNVTELSKSVSLVKQLSPIVDAINQLHSSLDGTFTVVGSEAYVASLSFYNSVRDAAKRDVPGAKAIYEDLQKRFPGRPSAQKPTPAQSTAAQNTK